MFKINQLKKNLYESQGTQFLYWIIGLRHTSLEYYLGENYIFPTYLLRDNTQTNDKQLKSNYYDEAKVSDFVKYFYEISERRKGNNIKVFALNEFNTDIIAGYNIITLTYWH